MPMYEYAPDGETCDYCAGGFERLQSMGAKPLSECPECGGACHRVISAFAVNKSERQMMSPKNLESKGFTQYTKAGDGYYEKTAGKEGPDVIRR